MKRKSLLPSIVIAWGIFTSAGCSGAGGDNGNNGNDNHQTTDYCGDIKVAVFPIRNGVDHPDPSVVSLTASQQKSVGALIINHGEALCTGTLVSSNVVLTAAHCVTGLPGGVSAITFYIGEDILYPDVILSASSWTYHPSYTGRAPNYDIAVVVLNGDPLAFGMMPLPISCSTTRLVGEVIQAVGYGLTYPETGENTERLWTTLFVDGERSNYYSAYGSTTGTCQGDSGGPMLFTKSDGRVYVMGVVSSGDSASCLGHTYYPRTDYHCSFLDDYISVDPCMGETLRGRCSGSTAIWCEGGVLHSEDCSESGYECGTDAGGNYRCVPPPDPCEGETYRGRCDGDTAIWCELERVMTRNCAEYGYVCGLDGEGNYRCVEPADLCEGETFAGRCEGNTAVWCEENTIMRVDCAAEGRLCAQNEWGLYRCEDPPPPDDPCMGETFEGRCEGNTAIWCEGDVVNAWPCPEGTLCGNLGDGLHRCVDECALIGRAGRCTEDNKVRWCEDGVIKVRDCGICLQVCEWVDDAMGFYCVTPP